MIGQSMGIYALYSASDGESHLCSVEIDGSGPPLDKLLPCRGWRPFQCAPGVEQKKHPTPVAGMTIMLSGCMTIRVDGGTRRSVALGPGDMLLVLDTQGAGHATSITGNDMLRVTGVSFDRNDWPLIRSAFTGWPANLEAP